MSARHPLYLRFSRTELHTLHSLAKSPNNVHLGHISASIITRRLEAFGSLKDNPLPGCLEFTHTPTAEELAEVAQVSATLRAVQHTLFPGMKRPSRIWLDFNNIQRDTLVLAMDNAYHYLPRGHSKRPVAAFLGGVAQLSKGNPAEAQRLVGQAMQASLRLSDTLREISQTSNHQDYLPGFAALVKAVPATGQDGGIGF